MLIAIVTFDGFNEIDSLVAMNILGRALRPAGRVVIASNTPKITSMNGVRLHAQATLADARSADAVILGSGVRTLEIADDASVMSQLRFDPARQLIGAQCSGALLLAKLGLLEGLAGRWLALRYSPLFWWPRPRLGHTAGSALGSASGFQPSSERPSMRLLFIMFHPRFTTAHPIVGYYGPPPLYRRHYHRVRHYCHCCCCY